MKLQVFLLCVAACRGQYPANTAGWNDWNGWSGAPLATTYSTTAQSNYAADQWKLAAPMLMASSPLGQAFSYGDARLTRSTLLGINSDSYSYLDSDGKMQTVNFLADQPSFRTASANMPMMGMAMAAPVPVQDTPEVAAAKAEFMAKFRMAEQGAMPMMPMAGPAPVQDTPEVAAAKAQFMAAFRAAEMRQRKRRSVPVVGLTHTPASTALLPLRTAYWGAIY